MSFPIIHSRIEEISIEGLPIQWLRDHWPMQGAWVQSLAQEDPTYGGATKPQNHNNCAYIPQPLKAACPRACALPQEKPPQGGAQALQLESSPRFLQRESPCTERKTQCNQKLIIVLKKEISIDFWQGCQDNSLWKKSFQQMVPGRLDTTWKTMKLDLFHIPRTKMNSKWIVGLDEWANTIKLLKCKSKPLWPWVRQSLFRSDIKHTHTHTNTHTHNR